MKQHSLPLFLCLLVAAAGALPVACGEESDEGETRSPITGCTEDADCGDPLHCSPEGSCVGCTSDGHCGRAQRCDPASYSCLFRPGWGDECDAHDDCLLGMFCSQGLCIPGKDVRTCGALGQCPPVNEDDPPMRCNRELNVCEEDLGCFGERDCLPSEVCNPGTGKCEMRCTEETEFEVCQARERCLGGRCVECAEDSDCGPGLICNVAAGRCAGRNTCFSDRDCEAGKICNRATSTCTVAPPPCMSNDDCLFDERCDLLLGRCLLRACQPDADEPNDDQASATPLGPGTRRGLTVCGAEEDWYRFALRRGDRLNINIEADPLVAGGLDAQIRDAAGRELDRDPLFLDTVVSQDGDYFLRIRTRDEQATYILHVIVVRGTPCDDDTFEENDTVTQAAALPHGERRNLQMCPGDRDYYQVEVPSGRSLSVRLTHDPLNGDLDLVAYDSDGTTELAASRTTEPVEQVVIDRVSGGRAYLLVLPSDDRTQNAYDLAITAQ